jgi:beta-glucosidase
MSGAPHRWLVDFAKAHLRRDETQTIRITIDPRQLSMVDANGNRMIQPGKYKLYVGGSQPEAEGGIYLPFQIEGESRTPPWQVQAHAEP